MSDTPGWDAINAALKPLYGNQEPQHFGPVLHYRIGGKDPLDGISVYAAQSPMHWHYVTYGFSELYAKELDDADVSGYGFELTFRLANETRDLEPPAWALNFLQNMARYVFSSGNCFGANHTLNLNGPIALEHATKIEAIAFTPDPQLAPIDTLNGRIEFLQVVGLTLTELETIQDWDAEKFLDELAKDNPLLVTDLSRNCLLDDPAIRSMVEAEIDRDGSKCGLLYTEASRWAIRNDSVGDVAHVSIGANQAERFVKLLRGRIPYGRDFHLLSKYGSISFFPGDRASWTTDDTGLTITLTKPLATRVAEQVRPQRGQHSWTELPRFRLEIVPSEIKDGSGKVIRVIG